MDDIKYNLNDDEIILMEDIIHSYFENIVMKYKNSYVKNDKLYDFVMPDKRDYFQDYFNVNEKDNDSSLSACQTKNVKFKYQKSDDSAVKNITFVAQGGKVTALVGHSGAGKSTIMNLIPRFYQPQGGEIFIDDQNTKSVSLKSLRSKIAIVSQDTVLFDDTVENNIRFAKPDAGDDDIKNACKLAAAEDFILDLPQQYKTLIGENGSRLSGGEKQRLSIARAILKNSPIVLLDEATSSLDTESEEKVQNAMFNLTKNRTTIVIAHRLSTIKKANHIIVMKNGNIVESGTHDELLKNSKVYENLYKKQVY